MLFTEKLGLPVLEGTDSISNITSQGNGISNRLEELLGDSIDDIQEVPEIKTDIEEINNDIETLNTTVEMLNTMTTKEKVVINGTEQIVDKIVAKLSATSTGNINSVIFKSTEDDDDHRHSLMIEFATLIVDLTDTLNVIDESSIILKSVTTYQNGYEYMAERNNMPFDVVALGKIPNDNNVKLIMTNRVSSLQRQTRSFVGGIEVWSPGHQPPYAYNEEVIVTLEFYKLA